MATSLNNLLFLMSAYWAPLVPVIIMFLVMGRIPGKIEGTYLGLKFRFSSSAAMYCFLVFIVPHLIPPLSPVYEQWKVTGTLHLEKKGDSGEKPQIDINNIRLVPPNITIHKGGVFTIDLVAQVKDDKLNLPQLQLWGEGYQARTINLTGKQDKFQKKVEMLVDKRDKEVEIEPITLEKAPQ